MSTFPQFPKYRVERLLGEGGMGRVYLVRHEKLGQLAAIKTLHPESARRPELVERFLREARAAARLSGEHVVRILDVDETEDGEPYFVMEYLEGSDLDAHLRQRGAFAMGHAVDCVIQACEALAEAHQAGVVHRDIKPANLFLAERGNGTSLVKVLDFGISKVTSDASSVSLTATDAVVGSPLYMSPEQLRGSRDIDARTDIWSLGVVLYQLLGNRLPFDGARATAVAAAIAADAPHSLHDARPDLPPDLGDVVTRCLAKLPAERFASAEELALALQPFATDPKLAERVVQSARSRGPTDAAPAAAALGPTLRVQEAARITAEASAPRLSNSDEPADLLDASRGDAWADPVARTAGSRTVDPAASRRRRIVFATGLAGVLGVIGAAAYFVAARDPAARGDATKASASAAPPTTSAVGSLPAPLAMPPNVAAAPPASPPDPAAPVAPSAASTARGSGRPNVRPATTREALNPGLK